VDIWFGVRIFLEGEWGKGPHSGIFFLLQLVVVWLGRRVLTDGLFGTWVLLLGDVCAVISLKFLGMICVDGWIYVDD